MTTHLAIRLGGWTLADMPPLERRRGAARAFPSQVSAASVAACHRAGFLLLGERNLERPAGRLMRGRHRHWEL